MAKRRCQYEYAVDPYCARTPDFDPSIVTIADALLTNNSRVKSLINLCGDPPSEAEKKMSVCTLCVLIASRPRPYGLRKGETIFWGVNSSKRSQSKK